MNVIEIFSIYNDKCLKLKIPDFRHKQNCYMTPMRSLHWFDIAYMYYGDGLMEVEIKKDGLGEIVSVFSKTIKYALSGKAQLPRGIFPGRVSVSFSIDTANDNEDVDYSNVWLFSTASTMQTWFYTSNNSLFLEISNIYSFLFIDPEKDEKYVSLEEYVKTYQPIVIYEISKQQAQKWVEQCEFILTKMDKP